MGTYFHGGSEFQGDGLQTLILMNPGYVGYADTQHHQQQPPQATNFVFLNSPASAAAAQPLNPPNSPHAPSNDRQHLVGVPLNAHGSASTHGHPFFRPVHYNMQTSIDPAAAREATPHRQTLSLSLSSRREVQLSGGSASATSGVSNGVNVLVSSKYLKAAQELLEEVVKIGIEKVEKDEFVQSAREASVAGGGLCGGETSGKRGGELTSTERQEAQIKKAKLVNMLDEVEQRYWKYHNQIQNMISWFEQSTGIGSARTYTALALQTISKQFRYLKDTINNQICATRNTLGEEEEGCRNDGSGLKFVDHQLKQQRAMQQLGMVQPNNWRPQRGLPGRAVSVLRAWLFEHFLHPYPKDSDKVMLAKQTGLSRSQVSNWFINARVRLWKPMVEDMYVEETKGQEQSKPEDAATKRTHDKSETKPYSNPISPENPIPTPSPDRSTQNTPTFSLIDITQGSPKKQRTSETLQSLPENFPGGFGSYPIGEITRFGREHFSTGYSGNGVSLTLGLPHCETLSMQGRHQGDFVSEQSIELGRNVEISEGNEFVVSSSQSTDVFENINLQDRKRFAAQLVKDYVV